MRRFILAVGGALMAAAAVGPVHAAGGDELAGIWRNPKNTVQVRVEACGRSVCGTVVRASDRAKQKARARGTANLVGTQLFREFRQTGPSSWAGRVFVPDLGRSFSGSLRRTGPNTIVARGCLVAGVFCKSQTWTRVG